MRIGERAVVGEGEVAAVAECVAVDRVVDQVGVRVVHGYRPERVDRWQLLPA